MFVNAVVLLENGMTFGKTMNSGYCLTSNTASTVSVRDVMTINVHRVANIVATGL